MKRLDYKWVMLALVSSAYFLAQGTRQIYNSVLPQIKSDFLAYGITDTQLGIVGSAFALAFGIAIPLLLGMAYAPTFLVCVAAPGVFGFATGIYDSNLYASLLEVVKPRYRAAAVGIFGCGGCILGALDPGMLGWMSANFSMRIGFASLAVSAAIGAVVILVARCVTFERDRI